MNQLQALISSTARPVTVDSYVKVTVVSDYDGTLDMVINIRQLDDDGNLITSAEHASITGPAASLTLRYQLTTGQLIQASLRGLAAPDSPGLIYAKIELQQGPTQASPQIFFLTGGFIASTDVVSWPDIPPVSESSIVGATQVVPVPTPAPGADLSYVASSNAYTTLLAGNITLTTDGNVANRTMVVAIEIDPPVDYYLVARTTQPDSTTRIYQFWNGPNMPADSGMFIYLPLPILPPGTAFVLNTLITNIQAGDQLSSINIYTTTRTPSF